MSFTKRDAGRAHTQELIMKRVGVANWRHQSSKSARWIRCEALRVGMNVQDETLRPTRRKSVAHDSSNVVHDSTLSVFRPLSTTT